MLTLIIFSIFLLPTFISTIELLLYFYDDSNNTFFRTIRKIIYGWRIYKPFYLDKKSVHLFKLEKSEGKYIPIQEELYQGKYFQYTPINYKNIIVSVDDIDLGKYLTCYFKLNNGEYKKGYITKRIRIDAITNYRNNSLVFLDICKRELNPLNIEKISPAFIIKDY